MSHGFECFITAYRILFNVIELTLSMYVWRWACNLLHGNRCGCRWARGCLEPK